MSNKLIMLRHGESQWNLENRFTGWKDVGLTKKGENEAKEAGLLISKNNLKIDTIFTSYLKRAVDTAKICLDQINNNKLDLVNNWRLNERHYGALQGLNKSETAGKYGHEQVMIWRRSFDVSPTKWIKIMMRIQPRILDILILNLHYYQVLNP